MPEVPARMVLLGNSGQGKTLCAQNMLLKHYRGCFVAIYIWAPTAKLGGWEPVFEYMKTLGQDPEKTGGDQQCVFEDFNNADLVRVISEHEKLV